ncbi:MAG: BatD family protein, partial [Methylococcales bacterium]
MFLALLVVAPQRAAATQISVAVDRNPVSIDESFQITFTANESPDDDPDFAPLEEDLEVLNQSHASNSSWINGKSSKTIQWTLNVMARQAGNLTIPAIKFGNDVSDTATVKVIQGAVKKDIATDEDLFLEVEATPQDPYVQSQVIYIMRLYVRVNIAQASLNEPEIADAVVEKLGEDSKYTTQVNGVEYSVIERRYAIFPQKSGTLTIKPLMLTAEVITNSRPSFNGFFNSQVTQTKHVKSKPISLNVKPAPAGFSGQHWLSAQELVLKQEWSGDNQQIKVGEPLTRTLTLLAKGTTVGQLPELNTSKTDEHLKSYPDQPVLQEQKKSEGVLAFREEKVAL